MTCENQWRICREVNLSNIRITEIVTKVCKEVKRVLANFKVYKETVRRRGKDLSSHSSLIWLTQSMRCKGLISTWHKSSQSTNNIEDPSQNWCESHQVGVSTQTRKLLETTNWNHRLSYSSKMAHRWNTQAMWTKLWRKTMENRWDRRLILQKNPRIRKTEDRLTNEI